MNIQLGDKVLMISNYNIKSISFIPLKYNYFKHNPQHNDAFVPFGIFHGNAEVERLLLSVCRCLILTAGPTAVLHLKVPNGTDIAVLNRNGTAG